MKAVEGERDGGEEKNYSVSAVEFPSVTSAPSTPHPRLSPKSLPLELALIAWEGKVIISGNYYTEVDWEASQVPLWLKIKTILP